MKYHYLLSLSALYFLFISGCGSIIDFLQNESIQENDTEMIVKKTNDFTITGYGSAENWNQAEWSELLKRNSEGVGNRYRSEFKILYSETGIYLLYRNEDQILNATIEEHFAELWYEDVVEAFFWTDESGPDYFEYELSPLNYELPLIVSNLEGELIHWIPFSNSYHEESDRKTRHKTSIIGGEKSSGAEIEGWMAEVFIPFKLMHPLKNIFPESGTLWRANFYRVDYDNGMTAYSWQPYETNFHDYENYGTLIFE